MSDIPLHIKIMAKLGVVKVTKKAQEEPRIYKDSEDYWKSQTKKRRSYKFPTGITVFIAILLPVILGVLPIFDNEELTIQEKAKAVADKEGKNDWQELKWDNPEAQVRLMEIKFKVDSSSCQELGDIFNQNERWTLRAYVAHTILEKCK